MKQNGKVIDVKVRPKLYGEDNLGVFVNEAAILMHDAVVINENSMIIYGAKYFFENIRELLKRQPCIESITK